MNALDGERLAHLQHWAARSRPMPRKRIRLPYHKNFTGEDMATLAAGMLPTCMEDKWVGILHEGSLDFYRSWTGYHIYRLHLRQSGDGIVADGLVVNREPKQYTCTDDGHDLEFVTFLLNDRWLRGSPA